MIKKIAAGACLLLSTAVFSQENNASPYSYYGIGDIKFKGTVENRSMGGLGVVPDSIHLNLQNPATYSALKLTTFTVSASTSLTKFKTSSAEDDANRTTLDYLAVGIPVGKIGFAFGIMPYSSVGYKIQNEQEENGLNYYRQFNGKGGLNRVFGGVGYQITPKLSLGADIQYNFGNIETKSIVGVPDMGVQYPTREINKSDYSGASFNIGAVYQTRIKDKYDLFTSASFTPQSTLSSSTQREIATITLTSTNNEIIVDVIDQSINDEEIKLPSKLSVGSGIGQARKWFAGAEYTFRQSNELGNRFDNVTTAGFESSHTVSVGGYYIPNFMSFSDYFGRVTYRAGLKYEKTGLVVNNEPINDMSLSLGVGLPLSSTIGGSNLNVGVEMGTRGTTDANLIQENYFNVFISLSFNDRWFIKRKYD